MFWHRFQASRAAILRIAKFNSPKAMGGVSIPHAELILASNDRLHRR
jgi:hypothetical protein